MRDSELTPEEQQIVLAFRHLWNNLKVPYTHWTFNVVYVDGKALGELTDKNKVCSAWKDGRLTITKG